MVIYLIYLICIHLPGYHGVFCIIEIYVGIRGNALKLVIVF